MRTCELDHCARGGWCGVSVFVAHALACLAGGVFTTLASHCDTVSVCVWRRGISVGHFGSHRESAERGHNAPQPWWLRWLRKQVQHSHNTPNNARPFVASLLLVVNVSLAACAPCDVVVYRTATAAAADAAYNK